MSSDNNYNARDWYQREKPTKINNNNNKVKRTKQIQITKAETDHKVKNQEKKPIDIKHCKTKPKWILEKKNLET